eukprot:GEZU01038911.1.p1 GENE.GEZU01038911.1~~GEZU01038911.1.p1  ORF type:complete len:109 (+),score=5.77 GEZU01038911.1:79-405(+)
MCVTDWTRTRKQKKGGGTYNMYVCCKIKKRALESASPPSASVFGVGPHFLPLRALLGLLLEHPVAILDARSLLPAALLLVLLIIIVLVVAESALVGGGGGGAHSPLSC